MSDGRVRLRLAGEAGQSAPLPVVSEEARVVLPEPTLAIAGPGAEALAGQIREAARALGATVHLWHAHVRAGGDTEQVAAAPEEMRVRAPAGAMEDALHDLVRQGGEGASLRIAVGAPFVALRRATLSILVTGGGPAVEWDPALRSLRDRFELVLGEPRSALARELARRVLAR